jgi:DNA-binding transcriptional LysR family regulator
LGVEKAEAHVANVEAQLILILSGAYIGYLPDHYAAPFVAEDTLRRIDVPRTAYGSPFSLATCDHRNVSPVTQAFVRLVMAKLADSELVEPDKVLEVNFAD